MGKRYAIIGSGRQGTAAAYDIARFGDAERILMIDLDPSQSTGGAKRVNTLIGTDLAQSETLDVADPDSLEAVLLDHRIDVFLAGTPYRFNLGLTEVAIRAGLGMTDLGGNSQVILSQLELAESASAKGISIVPDCGMGPGMTTTLGMYAMEQLDETDEILIWDCGLPYNPKEPWMYAMTFDFNGLINEYHGECLYIRGGEIVRVPVLEELEVVCFPEPIGELEAFTTAGGLTTAVHTFAGKLQTLQNKTLRYPGHFAQLKVMQRLGLFDEEVRLIAGQLLVPRKILQDLWEPQIQAEESIQDFAIIRALARGKKDGKATEVQVDFMCQADEASGFTAMEISTGWHAAILTQSIARGEIPPGVIPLEKAMSGTAFVREGEKRGFQFSVETRNR